MFFFGGLCWQGKVARIQTWESAQLERLRQMPSPLEFVGKARRELRTLNICGVSNGQVLVTVRREERIRDTPERSGGGRAWGGAGATPGGRYTTESNDCGAPSLRLSFAPRRGWGAAGDDGDGAGGASWKTLHGPGQHRSNSTNTEYRLIITTDIYGSGSLPFHATGSLWNHNGIKFQRPSPRNTTDVVSAADISHYQRSSPYPEFLHSSTIWGSWESWLPGHVRQPPILSGHCRPAKFTSSTHPAIFLPVAQLQHGPSSSHKTTSIHLSLVPYLAGNLQTIITAHPRQNEIPLIVTLGTAKILPSQPREFHRQTAHPPLANEPESFRLGDPDLLHHPSQSEETRW